MAFIIAKVFPKRHVASKLETLGKAPQRKTAEPGFILILKFWQPDILGAARFTIWPDPKLILYRGVEIRWSCDPEILSSDTKLRQSEFPPS